MNDLTRASDTGPVQAVITLKVVPEREAEFRALEGRLGAACLTFPGFLASELRTPVPSVQEHWVSRFSFDTPEHLKGWLDSEIRHRLLEEMSPLLLEGWEESVVPAVRPAGDGVTVFLHLRPRPGREREYARWQEGINAAAAQYPGFQEARVFPPQPPYQPEWGTVYAFDNSAHLRAWLESDTRREWLERGKPLFDQTSEQHLAGGFGAWFTPAHGGRLALPPGWKQVMAVLLVLYPMVMVLGATVEVPLRRLYPKPIWMFATNVLSAILLQYVLMNLVNWGLRSWLVPDSAKRARIDVIGVVVVLACYVLLIGVFLAVHW